MGLTGAGKSLYANAVIQGAHQIETDPISRELKVKVPLYDKQNQETFIVGQSAVSETTRPNCFVLDEILNEKYSMIVDCPGFGDTDKLGREYPNATICKHVMMESSQL